MSQETSINQSQSIIVRKKRQPETSGNVLPQREADREPARTGVKEMVANPTNNPETTLAKNYLPQNPAPSGAPTATTQHTQLTPPQNEPVAVNRFLDANTAAEESYKLAQTDDQTMQENKVTINAKRKRLTKAERQKLIGYMVKILESGYSFDSIHHILGFREDFIIRIFWEFAVSHSVNYSQHKHIIRNSRKFKEIPWLAKETKFLEAVRGENGIVILKAANLDEIRANLKISL